MTVLDGVYVNGPRYLVLLDEKPSEPPDYTWGEVIAAGYLRSSDGANDPLYFSAGDRVFVDASDALFVDICGMTLAIIDEQDAYLSVEEDEDEAEEATSAGD